MIYTGNGLAVRLCTRPTNHDHWLSFVCYTSLKRYLPDAKFELAVYGRPGYFFDWARRLGVKISRRENITPAPMIEADDPNVLALAPTCIPIREWSDDRFLSESWVNPEGTICLRREGELQIGNLLCGDTKSEHFAPFADVAKGVGGFVNSDWLDSPACFLSYINAFKLGNETQTELAVLSEWRRAIAFATCLGLNKT